MIKPVDLDHFRVLLEARHAELTVLIASGRNQVKPVLLDQTSVGRLSRMDAIQVQAMAQETERRRHIDLKRIETALARLKVADFGFCLLCGDDIPVKRLEFDPSVATCVDCARY